jgi:hypothetical protein
MNYYYNLAKYKTDFQENQQKNQPLYLLNICIMLDIIGHILNLIHFIVFGVNGVGVQLLSVANTVLLMASHYLVSAIVVLIAWGWTVNVMDVDQIDDMALPLLLVFGVVNLIVQVKTIIKGTRKDRR